MQLTDLDKQIIRALQENLPQTLNPYQTLADQLGISEPALLDKVDQYLESGVMRRLGGVVRHHRLGYRYNVMVVWQVPAHQVTAVGRHMAARPEISHCYERQVQPDWPYNLFTMIHGTSREACEMLVTHLAAETGISHYQMLYSLKELKKTSMVYFK
jgi:siroheme decarboxylase